MCVHKARVCDLQILVMCVIISIVMEQSGRDASLAYYFFCHFWNKREEAADLMNSIQDLQHGNKQLAVQNIKLQRTIEAAEELNSKLSEEIIELKGRLRG